MTSDISEWLLHPAPVERAALESRQRGPLLDYLLDNTGHIKMGTSLVKHTLHITTISWSLTAIAFNTTCRVLGNETSSVKISVLIKLHGADFKSDKINYTIFIY